MYIWWVELGQIGWKKLLLWIWPNSNPIQLMKNESNLKLVDWPHIFFSTESPPKSNITSTRNLTTFSLVLSWYVFANICKDSSFILLFFFFFIINHIFLISKFLGMYTFSTPKLTIFSWTISASKLVRCAHQSHH